MAYPMVVRACTLVAGFLSQILTGFPIIFLICVALVESMCAHYSLRTILYTLYLFRLAINTVIGPANAIYSIGYHVLPPLCNNFLRVAAFLAIVTLIIREMFVWKKRIAFS